MNEDFHERERKKEEERESVCGSEELEVMSLEELIYKTLWI